MKEEVVAGLNQRKGVYVHKILSEDLDAVVLTQDFEGSKLEGEQAVRYWSAIKMLMEEIPVLNWPSCKTRTRTFLSCATQNQRTFSR